MDLHDFLTQALAALDLLDEVERRQASIAAELEGADNWVASRAVELGQLQHDYDDVSAKLETLSEIITVFSAHLKSLDEP